MKDHKKKTEVILGASFRDPSGFVFKQDGEIYRQVNLHYQEHYDCLMQSGLYKKLSGEGMLVTHEVASTRPPHQEDAYLVIKPGRIPFISHPYEWCFSQLKDAALLTLYIAREALSSGMVLKDASAYNVQYRGAFPVFIDTLSFEKYQGGKPWEAYRQFCQHFLAPLSLMAYRDVRLSHLLQTNIDGVPLDLASKLLPWRTRLNAGLMTHIHIHASAQARYANRSVETRVAGDRFTRFSLLALLDSLDTAVKRLSRHSTRTEWANYYQETNYNEEAFQNKRDAVLQMLESAGPGMVWDLGANTGVFSRLASEKGWMTVAWDVDPAAVEINYLQCKNERNRHLIPLTLDLYNPSPSIGWQNEERASFLDRAPVHAVMALALVHHLAISNNLPLDRIAGFLGQIAQWVIIEFVPKKDSQVQRLLASRKDIFPTYTKQHFEKAMGLHFHIRNTEQLEGSERTLYLLENRYTLSR